MTCHTNYLVELHDLFVLTVLEVLLEMKNAGDLYLYH